MAEDVPRDKRLQAIANEVAALKESIAAITVAVNTQSALMLAAVSALEDATEAVTAAVGSLDDSQTRRDAVQVSILEELRWLRKHMEYITNAEEDCEITDAEEYADGN